MDSGGWMDEKSLSRRTSVPPSAAMTHLGQAARRGMIVSVQAKKRFALPSES